jgi:thiol-disulfide isomerase/thioredoxin
MRTELSLCAVLLLLAIGPAAAGAVLAPPSGLAAVGDGEQEAEELYGDPDLVPAQIADAVARAKRKNKRVLIQWGGEWSTLCHLLHTAWTRDRGLSRKLLYEYEVVYANIGRWDRNMDLAASYGADLFMSGVPYLTLLDGAGKPLANQETHSFEKEDEGDGLRHDAVKLLAFLALNQAEYREAEEIFEDALTAAKRSERRLFLTFGAPWCGWCHRLEDWTLLPDVALLLAKDFVISEVDIERTIGGEEMLLEYRGTETGGIPWFVILDAEGEVLATSDGPDGNIGCPWTDEEKAVFEGILRDVTTRMSDEDLEVVLARLGPQKEEPHPLPREVPANPVRRPAP